MIKRNRPSRRGRSPADEVDLIRLSEGMASSTSRLEDQFWQTRLSTLVERLLKDKEEDTLNGALDQLSENDVEAYNALADTIESVCESTTITLDGDTYDVLMFSAPLLTWSRWQIASGNIPAETLRNLRTQLGAHVFARNARIGIGDFLYSPDQLPRGFVPTLELLQSLTQAAFSSGVFAVPAGLPETRPFLSDTRYVIGVVVVPQGGALFRWQEEDGDSDESIDQWQRQGGAALTPLLPGAAFEALLPGAYHTTWREADRASRAYSLRATVAFLMLTLNLGARELQAVIGPFQGKRLEEYRVGFLRRGEDKVLHGVVWPLLDGEDEHTDCVAEIEAVLKEIGIVDIMVHEHDFPLDYCDDCGSPLYPTPEGELLHTEMPEEVETVDTPRHLH
ncbi:DUF2863 family protein [Amantichitinum ursilacus]|uniref:DUF2863 domain-containing protein n=1 Tax=Amantichitinum ursilacus TaxID=857265 RepID=A0A0N0XJ91_9NEIS|nr:DUF2863 family protein [Amantichitinum ursilacus]KPC50500.1 hypothetical protein WG78_16885 [Amantichitinum ursilacus]